MKKISGGGKKKMLTPLPYHGPWAARVGPSEAGWGDKHLGKRTGVPTSLPQGTPWPHCPPLKSRVRKRRDRNPCPGKEAALPHGGASGGPIRPQGL